MSNVYFPEKYIHDKCSPIETDAWFYIKGSASLEKEAGWKIYMPYTPQFAERTLSLFLPFFFEEGLHFKYIKSQDALIELNSGRMGYSQIGKCLIVYMPKVKDEIINSMMSLGHGLIKAYPTPPYLSQISYDPPIFYRFGSYIFKSENKIPSKEELINISSERHTINSKKLTNFSQNEILNQQYQTNLDKLLIKYPVATVLVQRGKGGVFIGIDFSSEYYKEVIIKVGYLHGEENRDGYDGFKLIKNEHFIIDYFRGEVDFIKLPRILEFSQSISSYAIVLEKIAGINARSLLLNNNLTKKHINKIIKGIKSINNFGVMWGDAKIDNIIIDLPSGNIYFIDFETAFFSKNKLKKEDALTTFKLPNDHKNLKEGVSYDMLHFFISILFNLEMDNQKNISIKYLTTRIYKNEAQTYCSQLLKSMLT